MNNDMSEAAALDAATDARYADVWAILYELYDHECANANYLRTAWIIGSEQPITAETVTRAMEG